MDDLDLGCVWTLGLMVQRAEDVVTWYWYSHTHTGAMRVIMTPGVVGKEMTCLLTSMMSPPYFKIKVCCQSKHDEIYGIYGSLWVSVWERQFWQGTWWLTSRFRSEFHLSFTRPCHEFIRAFFGISMELFRMAVLGKPRLDSPKSQDDWIWSKNYEKLWWSPMFPMFHTHDPACTALLLRPWTDKYGWLETNTNVLKSLISFGSGWKWPCPAHLNGKGLKGKKHYSHWFTLINQEYLPISCWSFP